jgi:4-amino-4-deoxy-L-arabinose transferase-like glycosyltransferase
MKKERGTVPENRVGLDRLSVQILVLAGLGVVIAASFYFLDFLGALEKTDFDLPYYTVQLQNLILHRQTALTWPLFRVFVPALSIGVSQLFGISLRHAMQLLSVLFMVLLICFIYYVNRRTLKSAFYVSAFFMTFPVIMLYAGTYFIELPFMSLLFASLWFWDRYVHTGRKKDLWLTVFFSVLGLLTKEAFLVGYVIMGAYAAFFFMSKRKTFPVAYASLGLFLLALAYFNYEFLFGFVKPLVLSAITSNTVTTNFHVFGWREAVSFFLKLKGGFFHVSFNVLLTFGMTHALILFFWRRERVSRRTTMAVYFCLLYALLILIAINVATGQRYVMLCFAPSYLLFISKKIPEYIHDRRLPVFCSAHVAVNLMLTIAYVIYQNRQ